MKPLALIGLSFVLIASVAIPQEFPKVQTNKSVWPSEIFLPGTGVPDEAEVTLTVEGIGDTIPPQPIDLVITLDISQSMAGEPLKQAKSVITYILTYLTESSGQSALVTFNQDAVLQHELTTQHYDLLPIVEMLFASGNTALGDAINVAQTELESPRRIEGNLPVILIISDGSSNRGANPLVAAQNAKASGTLIYALGIGAPVQEQLLRTVVSEPDSENYWHQPDPLMYASIYEALHELPTFLSARHLTVVERVHRHFDYVDGSFSVAPDTVWGWSADWSIGNLDIGETWQVTFRVTASDTGLLPVEVLPTSRGHYMNFAGGWIDVPFPQGYVYVRMGVGVEERADPTGFGEAPFSLAPNPFSRSVTVSYVGDGFTDVKISVHDLAGRLVTTLVDETPAAGTHTVTWGADNHKGEEVATGAYICRYESGGSTESRVMLLIR
jgi:uncharacterized protein YegL